MRKPATKPPMRLVIDITGDDMNDLIGRARFQLACIDLCHEEAHREIPWYKTVNGGFSQFGEVKAPAKQISDDQKIAALTAIAFQKEPCTSIGNLTSAIPLAQMLVDKDRNNADIPQCQDIAS
jgi:hypothetical protein